MKIIDIFNKLYYYRWNIGFAEKDIKDIILDKESQIDVKWVKHSYRDRFFADPFILNLGESQIQVLVEEFPYSIKKGIISLLTIDRNSYTLIDRKVVLEQSFHMSYPYIQRDKDNNVMWVAPEASMSGRLYRYSLEKDTNILTNQVTVINHPLLDSTIVEYDNMFWLFCTKRGDSSNSQLHIYFSNSLDGPWEDHPCNPVLDDSMMARPAGYMVNLNDTIYRFVQKNDKSYGERIYLTKIVELSTTSFKEVFVKELYSQNDKYSYGFHTINGYENICVVDGLCKEFAPLKRICFELKNKLLLR